jgi:hypothetical protein
VFGRDKTTTAVTPSPAPVKEGGKGRATPTRREAEARNRRPVVGPAAPPRGATREERKAQRQARAAASRQARLGAMTGDEKYLPARDRGPARRFVRDYIDARFNLGELFLPVAILSLFIGFVPAARVYGTVALYVVFLIIVVDSVLLARRIKALVAGRFGEKATAGVGMYAVLRGLQTRRLRVPKPVVARGEHPK